MSLDLDGRPFNFILRLEAFEIPSDSPYLKDITPNIYSILLEKRQYKVQSNVTVEVFQQFIDYLKRVELPDIQNNNISEFDQLSQEFGLMKDLIKLFKKLLPCFSIPSIGKIEYQDYQDFDEQQQNEQIILNLFNPKGKNSETQYKLLNSYKKENFKFKGLLSQIETKEENGLLYVIFKNNMTAGIFRNKSAQNDIIIPRSIFHHSQEFIVTSIIQNSFKNSKKIESIQFSEDSELRIIGRKAFASSSIRKITIPSHVTEICERTFSNCDLIEKVNFSNKSELRTIESGVFSDSNIYSLSIPSSVIELKEGWCEGTSFLSKIKIIQNEVENIKYIDNKFLVGKSSKESENFDVLLFARRDISRIVIPPYIRIISPYAFENVEHGKIKFAENSILEKIGKYAFNFSFISEITFPSSLKEICDGAFYNCDKLKKVNFSTDSELKSIGSDSFVETSFESIFIPSKVTELKEGFCSGTPSLIEVSISPQNKNYSLIDETFIVGKSNPESENYDLLLFACKDIEEATIPSFIKRICDYAFCRCNNLKSVTFSDDSELEEIGKYSFFSNDIKSITIPPSVKIIENFAFAFSEKLKSFNFSENSKLMSIGEFAFFDAPLKELSIPSSLVELKEGWCGQNFKLKKISVMPNNQYFKFIDDSILVEKSSQESEIYDVLIFARKDVKKVTIPSFIKRIANNAFEDCSSLKYVTFSEGSQLLSIGKNAFKSSAIKNISIPSNVIRIEESAFNSCRNLKKTIFEENSELRKIDKNVFYNTSLRSFSIPPKVDCIDNFALSNCANIGIVEINSKLISFNLNSLKNSNSALLLVPSKTTVNLITKDNINIY